MSTPPTTQTELKRILTRARLNFPYFVNHIFSKSFDKFTSGKYINDVAEFYQNSWRTFRIAPKDHFKSTGIYAWHMWKILQNQQENTRSHYFSFENRMAQYHVGKIREFIEVNPFYKDIHNLKNRAEGTAKYSWDGEYNFAIVPHGMMSFKRGIHDKIIVVDDPFQDPANKLDAKIITKINNVFKTQIMDMVMQDGELHTVGTPQTNVDFFFETELRKQFRVMETPAIVNEARQEVLWPEWMGWDELMRRKAARGEQIFNQEYCCRPAYAEQAFFKREQLLAIIDSTLDNQPETKKDMLERYGGWDIGLKTHPAHFTVVEKGADGIHRQIYQKWFDRVDYTKQLEHVKEITERLKIDKVYYDGTRGEMLGFEQLGLMPGNYKSIIFTPKQKYGLATELGRMVTEKLLRIQDDQRQLNQLQVVTNDLDAIETHEGHGDCFWSLAMACWGFTSGPKFAVLTGLDKTTGWRPKNPGGLSLPF